MNAQLNDVADDDAGAALVFALIVITVVGLVSAGILFLGDTSIRSTISMRDRASAAFAADAAAEVAVNQLRQDKFNGVASGCDAQTTVVLSNLYPATATAPGASAAVTCTPDENAGTLFKPGPGSPGTALLSLSTTEPGIVLDDTSNDSFKVKGGIFSNSTIELTKAKSDLANVSTLVNTFAIAMGACLTPNGATLTVVGGTPKCNYLTTDPILAPQDRRGMDLGTIAPPGTSFDAPTNPMTPQTPPLCTGKKVYELDPGLYTSAALLNDLTANCPDAVTHMRPGIYFLNFPAGAAKWSVSDGTLIGGTVVGTLKTNPVPSIPGSCVAPVVGSTVSGTGVELVFGGESRLSLADKGNIELCASNATTANSGPPIVIYGLKTAVGPVPAQSGCITAVYDTGGCAVLATDQSPATRISLSGTTYAPRAAVDVTLNNNTSQVFRWGLQARVIRLHATGSPDLSAAVIEVPGDAPAPFRLPSQRYLYVYICPGSATCSTSGKLRLRASLVLSGLTPRTVTVTSWTTIR